MALNMACSSALLATTAMAVVATSHVRAQPSSRPTSQPTSQPGSRPTTLVAPKPLGSTQVPSPPDAPKHAKPVFVRVDLLVAKDGTVSEIKRLSPVAPAFDRAVIKAARRFRFVPARFQGKPVAVHIKFTQRFLPPKPKPKQRAQSAICAARCSAERSKRWALLDRSPPPPSRRLSTSGVAPPSATKRGGFH
jgi:TonB family protein